MVHFSVLMFIFRILNCYIKALIVLSILILNSVLLNEKLVQLVEVLKC